MGLLPCLLRSATSFVQSLSSSSPSRSADVTGEGRAQFPPLLMAPKTGPGDSGVSAGRKPLLTPRKQILLSQSLQHLPGGGMQLLPCPPSPSDAASASAPATSAAVSVFGDKVACLDRLAWIEHVLMLTMSLITVTNALPALAENGLVSLLVSVLKLPPVPVPAPSEDPLSRQLALRRTYVTGLLTQLLEQAIGSHGPSMTMFSEGKGFECALHRLADELDELDMTSYLRSLKTTDMYTTKRVSLIPEESEEVIQVDEEEDEGEEDASRLARSLSVTTRDDSLTSPAAAKAAAAHTGGRDEETEGSPPSGGLVVSIRRPEDVSAASTIMLHSLLTLCTYFLQQSTQGKILREKLFSGLLLKIFSNMRALHPAISASSFILFSDVINNDPSILSHLIGNGVAESCLNACILHKTVRFCVCLLSYFILIVTCLLLNAHLTSLLSSPLLDDEQRRSDGGF
jgi:hypothetical protein